MQSNFRLDTIFAIPRTSSDLHCAWPPPGTAPFCYTPPSLQLHTCISQPDSCTVTSSPCGPASAVQAHKQPQEQSPATDVWRAQGRTRRTFQKCLAGYSVWPLRSAVRGASARTGTAPCCGPRALAVLAPVSLRLPTACQIGE